MNSNEIFTLALVGLNSPWEITRVEMEVADDSVKKLHPCLSGCLPHPLDAGSFCSFEQQFPLLTEILKNKGLQVYSE